MQSESRLNWDGLLARPLVVDPADFRSTAP
jgi:hypothetical protein